MANEITKEDVVKFIEGMTVLELSELVKELEQKFGVSAAAPVAMVAAAGPPGCSGREKTELIPS
jgi:large subunit ribosomal protein L7/L12